MKKITSSTLLLLVLALSLALPAQAQGPVSGPGELPIVSQPTKLTIMIVPASNIENFETNAFTLWLEEQTGLDLQFQVVPSSDAQAKLNVTLASGQLPDVFAGFSISEAMLAQMGADGLFVPLNDMIEQYGYESKRIFTEERPHLLPLITSPDGNIYGLPDINECFHCFTAQKMWIYKPWLDTLGLAVPTTTEEFYQVLKAFKEQDPNGNGKADEIPLSGAIDGWHTAIDEFLMNSFVFWDRLQHHRLLLQDGAIAAAYAQPGYKEGLEYMNRLYADGLLDSNALIQDRDQLYLIGNNPEINILGATTGGWQGQFVQAATVAEGGRMDEWVTVPALANPEGFHTAGYAPWGFDNGDWVVTSAAKNPEAAFRLGDFLYNQEATLRNVFGVKDVNWVYSEEGEVGINGGPALYRSLTEWTESIQNFAWMQSGITYRPSDFRLAQSNEGQYVEVSLFEASNANYMPYVPPIDSLIPPLVFTEDQARELADLDLGLKTYIDEMFVRFVSGDVDVDAEWNTYLATLDSLGLPRLLEIYQEAYDAQQSLS
ncbi:MAG: extracellular solute-binding protein [Anaerolineae bacterium]|nr:extracellular solute-binding protein [Anaerolineae bacterium]